MKKNTTISITFLSTLLIFSSVLFYSCTKEDNDQPNTFEITLHNPYNYPVTIDSREFKNTNHCYLLDKYEYNCTLGAGETRTYTGEIEKDNESGYVAIFFADATSDNNDNRNGIFDFYDAEAGESYCGELINLGELTPQNKPEVFLSSGGYCNFGNNGGGGGNGDENGGSGNDDNDEGMVVFWTNHVDSELVNGHSVYDQIHIFCDGQGDQLLWQMLNQAPSSCPTPPFNSYPSMRYFLLTPGVHNYDAYIYDWAGGQKYNKKEWHGTFSVYAGTDECTKILLNNL